MLSMKSHMKWNRAVIASFAIVLSLASVGRAQDVTVLVDEVTARADQLGTGKTWVTVNIPAINGTYRIIGHGEDGTDDGDSFNIKVAGGHYRLSVTDDACCTSRKNATTNADEGRGHSAEFKWFSDAPNGGGVVEHHKNSTGFAFNRNPLDSAKNPTASFRTFFGTAGRSGTYWVDIVVTGADGKQQPPTPKPDGPIVVVPKPAAEEPVVPELAASAPPREAEHRDGCRRRGRWLRRRSR